MQSPQRSGLVLELGLEKLCGEIVGGVVNAWLFLTRAPASDAGT